MGTSGAYGGSGSQAWTAARQLLDDLPAEGSSGASGGNDQDDDGQGLADLAGAIADALAGDDATLASRPITPTLSGLLPRAGRGRRGGGGGGALGGIYGESGGTGRSGASSRRSVARSAARGGAAIGGGYALRSGDRAALEEIGLDLDELRTLGPRAQCARILDAVLGSAGHPDEMALKIAAGEQLKAIVTLPTPPAEADALRGFISAFVFQMGLVELRANLARGVIDAATATRKEGRLRRYLDQRVTMLAVPASGKMSISDFSAHANRLVGEAIALLRAR